MGQGNLDDLRAQFFKLLHSRVQGLFHFRLEAANHILFSQSKFQAFDVRVQAGGIMRNRLRDAGRIAMIHTA